MTDDLIATATGLRGCADDLRLLADRLRRETAEVWWEGRAGDAVRAAAAQRAVALEEAALCCDVAAGVVGRVDRAVEAAADAAEAALDTVVDTVVDTVAGGVEEVAEWLD